MAKAEPTIRTVKMDDERLVDFMGKRKLIKDSIIKDGVVTIRMDFVNGETRSFRLPDELLLKFAAHGAEQKLGDEVAGIEDVEDCVMAVDALASRLETGEWHAKRESNGMAGTSILAKALVEHSGKPIDVIKAFLVTKSVSEKLALRQNQAIAPIIAKMEANKKKKESNVDTDQLLEELV